MKTSRLATTLKNVPGLKLLLLLLAMVSLPFAGQAQVNTGSDGHLGALYPTKDLVIDMAAQSDGIYQFTSINIPTNVSVSFIPNMGNTPVVWLVQGNVIIQGSVNLSGHGPESKAGGLGGPGGYRGGTGGPSPSAGQGPGGGVFKDGFGGNASYGDLGNTIGFFNRTDVNVPAGPIYGNKFIVPLLGGSGGAGSFASGGGGGGGALLIAATGTVQIDGEIDCSGVIGWDDNGAPPNLGGAGSGGAVRIVASRILGSGTIRTVLQYFAAGGPGRIRFDTFENNFGGSLIGVFSQGFQPVLIPTGGQLPQLSVVSVGGAPVSATPTGVLSTPDAILSAQQANPIPVVVQCINLPLNTPITVSVKPINGLPVSAVGHNNVGALSSSTATVSINIPRGGGLIYATAATAN